LDLSKGGHGRGAASIAITLAINAHVRPVDDTQLAESVNRLFG
jgi:hypothetical protein